MFKNRSRIDISGYKLERQQLGHAISVLLAHEPNRAQRTPSDHVMMLASCSAPLKMQSFSKYIHNSRVNF